MAKKKRATKGASRRPQATAKKSASKKATPAKKRTTAVRKAAPARKKAGSALKALANFAAPADTAGGPAAEAPGKRLVKLVMPKSSPSTISASGTVHSNSGVEASNVRVRRTRPASLQLKPGSYQYVFKIEGDGSLSLEAQNSAGVTTTSAQEYKSDIPSGRVYNFEVGS